MLKEDRAALMDLAEQISHMRDYSAKHANGWEWELGRVSAFERVLKTIVKELDKK